MEALERFFFLLFGFGEDLGNCCVFLLDNLLALYALYNNQKITGINL
jgi:hypothetical protein